MTICKEKRDVSIAVLIPCFNEASTIGLVIQDFKTELPEASIYVFDNNSTDDTARISADYGAIVFEEKKQGKGNVVRSMFMMVDADIYLLIDGDATYSAKSARKLIEPIIEQEADMVVGNRMAQGIYHSENKRPFHSMGNRLVCWLVNTIFKAELNDIMSGYRVFSRLFVKTVPLLSSGFEIETEITLHALDKRLRIKEVDIAYQDRPENSHSKLHTYSDGFRILKTIFFVFKNYRPLLFFSLISLLLACSGFIIGLPTIVEYIHYQYVYKVPSAILAASLEILAALSFCCGLILDTVTRQHKELFEIQYKNKQ